MVFHARLKLRTWLPHAFKRHCYSVENSPPDFLAFPPDFLAFHPDLLGFHPDLLGSFLTSFLQFLKSPSFRGKVFLPILGDRGVIIVQLGTRKLQESHQVLEAKYSPLVARSEYDWGPTC
jgi:hypothetical protein